MSPSGTLSGDLRPQAQGTGTAGKPSLCTVPFTTGDRYGKLRPACSLDTASRAVWLLASHFAVLSLSFPICRWGWHLHRVGGCSSLPHCPSPLRPRLTASHSGHLQQGPCSAVLGTVGRGSQVNLVALKPRWPRVGARVLQEAAMGHRNGRKERPLLVPVLPLPSALLQVWGWMALCPHSDGDKCLVFCWNRKAPSVHTQLHHKAFDGKCVGCLARLPPDCTVTRLLSCVPSWPVFPSGDSGDSSCVTALSSGYFLPHATLHTPWEATLLFVTCR